MNAALERLGYPILSVAPRVGRRQLIDPERVDRTVRESRDRRDGADLRSLELIADFETFAEAEDHRIFIPAGFTTDDLCLTPRSGQPASAAFMARKRTAGEADPVLTNHAGVSSSCAPATLWPKHSGRGCLHAAAHSGSHRDPPETVL